MVKEIYSRGSAEITIVDLTDNRRLIAYIAADKMRQVVYDPDSNIYTPNYETSPIKLTPQLKIEGGLDDAISQATSVKWFVQRNSIDNLEEITDGIAGYTINQDKSLSITKNFLSTNVSMRYFCEIVYPDSVTNEDYTTLADIEIVKINNGSSGGKATVAILSNDSDLVPTDSDGTGGDYREIESHISIFEGSVDATANWRIEIIPSEGITGRKLGTNGYRLSSMLPDKGTVLFRATRSGHTTLERTFTITKVKNGRNIRLKRLRTSVLVLKKDKKDKYHPETVEIVSQAKEGNDPFSPNPAYFKITYSRGQADETQYYVSTERESSYDLVCRNLPNDISRLNVYLHENESRDNDSLIDKQTIQIVVDARDNIIPYINTPKGTVIRNSNGHLEAVMDIFKGTEIITPDGGYRWYKLSIDSSGDDFSGPGWIPVSTIQDSSVRSISGNKGIRVYPEAILGTETFMCIAVHEDLTLKATVSLSDLKDPYSVSILGSGIFKNGKGTNNYLCKVYLNGEERDTDGNTFDYTWSIMESNNRVRTDFTRKGKSISLTSNDINNKSVLICTVSEKE